LTVLVDHRDRVGVPLRFGIRVLHREIRDVADVDPGLRPAATA